jgi:hypothetical protein
MGGNGGSFSYVHVALVHAAAVAAVVHATVVHTHMVRVLHCVLLVYFFYFLFFLFFFSFRLCYGVEAVLSGMRFVGYGCGVMVRRVAGPHEA